MPTTATTTKRGRPGYDQQSVLVIAVDVFNRHGYDATSIQTIADQAGVAKGLVLHHFRSKSSLLEAVLEEYFDAHTEVLQYALRAADGSPRQQVHQLLDHTFDFMVEYHSHARMVCYLAGRRDDKLPMLQRHARPLLALVEAALGGFLPTDGPLSVRQFYITVGTMVAHSFAYAPLLDLGDGAEDMRREHVHWVADAMLDKLGLDPA